MQITNNRRHKVVDKLSFPAHPPVFDVNDFSSINLALRKRTCLKAAREKLL